MIVDGCSFWYIRLVVFWRGPVMTLIPLIWDGIVRTVKAVLPGYKILRALFGKWGL